MNHRITQACRRSFTWKAQIRVHPVPFLWFSPLSRLVLRLSHRPDLPGLCSLRSSPGASGRRKTWSALIKRLFRGAKWMLGSLLEMSSSLQWLDEAWTNQECSHCKANHRGNACKQCPRNLLLKWTNKNHKKDNKGKSGTLKFCTPYSSYYFKEERGHESSTQLYKTGLLYPDASHESTEKHSQTTGVEPETGFAVGSSRKTLAEQCKEAYSPSHSRSSSNQYSQLWILKAIWNYLIT